MLIIRAIILMIFLLPILANGESQSPISISAQQNNQKPSECSNKQSYKDKYDTESLKTTVKEIISQYNNNNIASQRSQQHHWYDTLLDRPSDWLMVLFSGLLVVATAFLVFYNCKLWKTTKGLLETSQEQSGNMERSLYIAKEAADSADRNARAAFRAVSTMQAQQRAYIFVKIRIPEIAMPKIEEDNINKIPNRIEIVVTNHGKTPAIITDMRDIIFVDKPPKKYDVIASKIAAIPDSESTFPYGTAIIDGAIEKAFSKSLFIDEENLRKVAILSSKLFCIGRITYKDIFDNSHETGFFWEYVPFAFFQPVNTPECNYHT